MVKSYCREDTCCQVGERQIREGIVGWLSSDLLGMEHDSVELTFKEKNRK